MKWIRHPFVLIASLMLIGLCLLGAFSLSCTNKASNGQELYSAPADLSPFANPGAKASLILFSTEIPVDLNYKFDGKDLSINLLTKGEEIEEELYRSEASKFLLVQAASERFDPPLPLLEFPVTVGQKLEWKGRYLFGPEGKDATATTIVTKDALNEKGLSAPAIKAAVELTFDGGAPVPAKRSLTFWFVEGKGIQKRNFDKGSTRVPAPPPGSSSEDKT